MTRPEVLTLPELLARGRGVASWTQLEAAGVTRSQLRSAVSSGGLRRLRRGWYATTWAHADVVTAVAAGGVLGCVSALRLHGVWVPPDPRLHVRAGASVTRADTAGRLCRQYGRPEPEAGSIDGVTTSLRHAVRCLDSEGIVVVCDSILYRRLMTEAEVRTALALAPQRIRRLVDRCDVAESGIETIVRCRLRSKHVALRVQQVIPGIGRVDFLIGNRLIVEVDGYDYHADPERFERDRERDRRATELGYLVIRLSYKQVMYDWASAESSIMSVIRRRDHLKALPAA